MHVIDRPNADLRPDYIRRRLDSDDRSRRLELTIAAEAACSLAYCYHSITNEKLFATAEKIVRDLIHDLIGVMDLTGLELCDEAGDTIGTITFVSEHISGSPYKPMYLALDNGEEVTGDYIRDVLSWGGYVKRPYSGQYGALAIVEAARAQIALKSA